MFKSRNCSSGFSFENTSEKGTPNCLYNPKYQYINKYIPLNRQQRIKLHVDLQFCLI